MNDFIHLDASERAIYCEQAEARTGLARQSIEKDFWVCWTLERLFTLPEWGPHFTFKGGTSLSKAWKLIQRFSEDIDIVTSRPFLGIKGDKAPESISTNKGRSKRLEQLKSVCQQRIADKLLPALQTEITKHLPPGVPWSLALDPDDEDQQTLLFAYPPATENAAYIAPVVRIELGARSDTNPSHPAKIQPLLAEAFPDLFPDSAIQVEVVAAERTFWEKVMLLHEERQRPVGKPRKRPLARHYYDLWSLIQHGIAEKAATDLDLFHRIAEHRAIFFRWSWVDYATLSPGSLNLIPTSEQLPSWQTDYAAMRGEMFYGEVPSFEEVLGAIQAFQNDFNRTP